MDSNSDSMTPTGTLSVMASTTDVIDASGATWKSVSSVTADILNTGSVLGTGSYEPQATTASHADPTQLQSSYSATITDSSQFPMQHATQQLPSNGVPMVTTDMVSRTSDFQQTSHFLSDTDTVSASGFSISSVSLSVSASVLDLDIASASVTESQNVSPMVTSVNSALETQSESLADQFDVIIDKPTVVSSKSITDSVVYDPNMTTEPIQASAAGSILVTSTGSIAQNVPLDSSLALDPSVSATSYYEATSRDLYSTFTASETTFSAAPGVVDSAVSLSTSAAVPLPPITVKPVQPTPKGQSTILGGGISDNILYIGASVGGVVLIVILLICVVCIRRRKNKHKGSLKKEEEQDLWMNSAVDIPLSVKNPFPGSNGSGSLTRKKDIGCTRYEAVFDFQGSHGNHLTLRQGDIVHVLRKEETGWWQGSLGVKSGWFPSNYVQSAPPDKVSTENEVELHKGSSPNVSSFMLRKTPEREDQYSYPTEEEIGAEPIYCKIQPKDKRSDKSSDRSSRSTSSTPTKSEPPTTPSNNYITPISDSSHEYRVLYTYEGRNPGELTINTGDIVMCKDNDKKGWMKGTNCTTRKEGWCPTSYLKKIEKHVKEGSAILAPDPSSYHQLEVNTQPGDKQDLVGIVHKATHTFSAEKAGDLEFDCGDYVTVFQILENGWWLGSKDKTVGWFPGSYVEMIEQPSSSPSPSISTHSSSTTDNPFLPEEHPKGDSPIPTGTITIPSTTPSTTPSTPTVSKTPSKLKPVRKAPPPPLKIQPKGQQTPPIPAKTHPISDTTPPTSLKRPRPTNDTTPPSSLRKPGSDSKLPSPAGGNKTPKPTGRPRIPPPAPPTRGVAREMGVVNPVTDMLADEGDDNVEPYYESLRNVENDNTYDDIKIDDKASTDDHSAIITKKEKIKPPVPKRYIKPKLVTVPRTEVKLPELPGLANLMKLRSPPPPKPVTPKLGPIRAKLSAPKSLEDQIPSVEDDTYFHVNSQRKFQDIVRKDSSEYESRSSESPPYRTVSSFGSSFGGNSFGNSFGKHPDEPTAKPVKAVQPMAKPVSSNIHKEPESDKPEQQATQSSVKAADKSAIIEEAEPTVLSKDTSSIGSTPINQVQAEDRTNNKVNIVCDNQIDNQMHEQSIVAAEIKDTNDMKVNKEDSKPKSGIPLAPKMKASKLPPPKHNLSNVKPESPKLVANAIENEAKPTTPTERVSKLPKSKEAVSKLPAKTSQDQNIFQYPQVTPSKENISGNTVGNTDKDNVGNNTVESIPDAQVPIAPSTNTQNEVKDLRPRTESFGRPPVAPKPKSKLKPPSIKTSETTSDKGKVADIKTDIQNIDESLGNPSPKTPNASSPVVTSSSIPSPKIPVPSSSLQSPKMPVSNPRRTSDSDGTSQTIKTDSDNDTKDTKSPPQSDTTKPQSKMPLPSTVTQKSPKIPRGRKSQLPSAGVRKPSKDRAKESTQDSNTAEVVPVVESPPSSNIKTKPESPQMSRIQSPKTPVVSAEQKSLRNRSSSPANRTGIPTSMRNRSNSPASKQSNLPTPGSAGSKSMPKQKRSGLVAPKKVLNGPSSGPKQNSIDGDSSHSPNTQNDDDDKITQDKDVDSLENSENKTDRPSKPPRVPKQSSQDSKSRKHGKSLLPMIHKSMEAGNGTQNGLSSPSQGNKHKRGIPVPKSVAKQAAPPKSPTSTNGSQTVGGLAKTLYQAVKGYTAQSEDELSFVEGTFIKELSDCDRSGWFVGMLADGTTGIYPADHFKPSPVSAQSEA